MIIDMLEREMPLTVESVTALGFNVFHMGKNADYTTYYFDKVILQDKSALERMCLELTHKEENSEKNPHIVTFSIYVECHEMTRDVFFERRKDFVFFDAEGPSPRMQSSFIKKVPSGRIIVLFSGFWNKPRYLKSIYFESTVSTEKDGVKKDLP